MKTWLWQGNLYMLHRNEDKMKHLTQKQLYIILLAAVVISSFVNVFSKFAAGYPFFSIPFLCLYGIALLIMAGYSVIWQLVLEKISLISAYMARGLLFILIYLWSVIIFHESVSYTQTAGAIIILTGVWLSQHE